MLQHIFHVGFRPLNVLLHIEVRVGIPCVPGLFLHHESDRMHRVDFSESAASHGLKEVHDFGRILGIQLEFYGGVVIDMNEHRCTAHWVGSSRVIEAVPKISPLLMLSHTPGKGGFLIFER